MTHSLQGSVIASLAFLSGCALVTSTEHEEALALFDVDHDNAYSVEHGGDDCDDFNASVFPGAEEVCNGIDDDCDGEIDEDGGGVRYIDADGDGYGDAADPGQLRCPGLDSTVDNADDCDDTNDAVHPEANETCDGVDQNCDGVADDGVGSTWWIDDDGDGFGSDHLSQVACEQPQGWSPQDTDCNDADPTVFPGASELCNGVDDNCNGTLDEDAIDVTPWYFDADDDGYGGPADLTLTVIACEAPSPRFVSGHDDCDDLNPRVHPGADELCNGFDDNCDSIPEDSDATDRTTFYKDEDGDGLGNINLSVEACEAPLDHVANSDDCHDGNPDIGYTTWYADTDGDGFGNPDVSRKACSKPAGHVEDATDCRDDDSSAYPHSHEIEVPGDGLDVDCNGIDACTDLNCDGLPDILATSVTSGDFANMSAVVQNLLSNPADLSWNAAPAIEQQGAHDADAADFNGDGYLDLVYASYHEGLTSDIAGNHTNSFVYWGGANGYDDAVRTLLPTISAVAVCVADFNRDGLPDIFFANEHDQTVDGVVDELDSPIYFGSLTGIDPDSVAFVPTMGASSCATSDFDGDSWPDLVVTGGNGNAGIPHTYVYYGSMDGFSTSRRDVLITNQTSHVSVADLDADGFDDLVLTQPHVHIHAAEILWGSSTGFGVGTHTTLLSDVARISAVGDLNGDGLLDVVLPSSTGMSTRVYYGAVDGNGQHLRFASAQATDLPGPNRTQAMIQDIDLDGYADLLLATAYDSSISSGDASYAPTDIYWGDASGTLADTRKTTYFGWGVQFAVDVADLDGDGFLDLYLGGYRKSDWTLTPSSYVYWGSPAGPQADFPSEWETRGIYYGRIVGK